MSAPAVEVSDLVKQYGSRRAVDGLSLSVATGELVAVLGPNGAGKTTTIETCEGYRRPDRGRVRVLGLDPLADARALRPRVGVMLQTGGVPPGARTDEMLRLAASLYAHPHPVDDLVELLGLAESRRTPYRRLSGGQQRRLAFALAVVGRPELVFLDEPTAGLDPHARRAIHDVVRDLRAAGVTVVLSTHLLDEAERLADRIVIVERGQLLVEGTPDELTRTGSPEVLRFSGPRSLDVSALLAALPSGCVAAEGPHGTYRVEGAIGPGVLATVTAWCAQQGFMPAGLDVGRRSLEDVYLELTGRQPATGQRSGPEVSP